MVQKLAFGLKKITNRGQKRLKYNKIGKIGLNSKKIGGIGCHKVGTALKTSRLTSLAQLPDQESSKYGVKGTKMLLKWAKKAFLAIQISHILDLRGLSNGLNWSAGMSMALFQHIPQESMELRSFSLFITFGPTMAQMRVTAGTIERWGR